MASSEGSRSSKGPERIKEKQFSTPAPHQPIPSGFMPKLPAE